MQGRSNAASSILRVAGPAATTINRCCEWLQACAECLSTAVSRDPHKLQVVFSHTGTKMPLTEISPNIQRLPLAHSNKPGRKRKHPLELEQLDYLPPPPRKRKQQHYDYKTVFAVLQFINYHTIYYDIPAGGDFKVPRYISGTAVEFGIVRSPPQPFLSLVLCHDNVPDSGSIPETPTKRQRPVTYKEVSDHFLIPEKTIKNWWLNRTTRIGAVLRPMRNLNEVPCQWPELETQLHEHFLLRRGENQAVTRAWFRRTSKQLFKQFYPLQDSFKFSNGWFAGFLLRHNLSRRRITHQAQKLPEEVLPFVNSFLR